MVRCVELWCRHARLVAGVVALSAATACAPSVVGASPVVTPMVPRPATLHEDSTSEIAAAPKSSRRDKHHSHEHGGHGRR